MQPEIKRSYIELHIAVFLFGFTAILGDLIELKEMTLVWWRLFFTCISLLFFRSIWKNFSAIPKRTKYQLMAVGCIVALHWVAFYGSVKYANASICLVCMATCSFFTALVEPLVMRTGFKWYELVLGLIIIPGMAFIVSYTPSDKYFGIALGIISALLAVIFSVLNKKILTTEKNPDTLSYTFIQLGSGLLFLTAIMPIYLQFSPDDILVPQTWTDIVLLLVLALFCTTLAYVLAFRALRFLSAFTSNLTINLEPVYGILLAWVLLGENKELHPNFYVGVVIILLAVFIHPVLKSRVEK